MVALYLDSGFGSTEDCSNVPSKQLGVSIQLASMENRIVSSPPTSNLSIARSRHSQSRSALRGSIRRMKSYFSNGRAQANFG